MIRLLCEQVSGSSRWCLRLALEDVVNGVSHILKPGMAGFVKPPDKVRHKTGPAGASAVVVWVTAKKGAGLPTAGRGSPSE